MYEEPAAVSEERTFDWLNPTLWICLIVMATIPVLVARYPPAPDFYGHLGRYYVLLHSGEPSLARYYQVHWHLMGNMGADLLAVMLGRFLGVDIAARLILAMVPALTAAGILWLSKLVHGRVQPTAVAALALIYSMPLNYGFLNYTLGVGLALLASAAWTALRDRPAARAMFAVVASGAIWICHFAAFGIFLVIVAAQTLMETRSLMRAAKVALPACWPLLLTLLWQTGGPQHAVNFEWAMKPHWLADFFRLHSKLFDRLSAAFVLAAVAGLGFIWWRTGDRGGAGLVLAGEVLLGLFVLLPDDVIGSSIADARLIPPALMLLLVGFSAPREHETAISIIAAVFAAARLQYTSMVWAERSSEIAAELPVLNQVPAGSRIATLAEASGCKAWPLFGMDHVSALAIISKHAFVNSEWDIRDTQLMRPVYNDGRDFNDVQSSYVAQPGTTCSGQPLAQRLGAFPRDRFDYLWSFVGPINRPWLSAVGRGPRGILYRVTP